jgi:hypothetical protein
MKIAMRAIVFGAVLFSGISSNAQIDFSGPGPMPMPPVNFSGPGPMPMPPVNFSGPGPMPMPPVNF